MIPKEVTPDISTKYFKEHTCSLPRNKLPHRIVCGRFRRWILEQTTVSTSDARARAIFRSYASLGAEKYRHYKHHPFTIHPYSKFKVYYDILMALLIFCWQISTSEHYSQLKSYEIRDSCHTLSETLDVIYVIHITFCFFTGFVKGDTQKQVVLDLKKASLHYLITWFIIDLVTIGNSLRKVMFPNIPFKMIIFIRGIRIVRIARLFNCANNAMKAFNVDETLKTSVNIILTFTSYIFWNIIYQFAAEFFIENSALPDHPRNCSWMTMARLWNETTTVKYTYSLSRAVFFMQAYVNSKFLEEDSCIQIFLLITWTIGQLLVLQCLMMFFVIFLAKGSAKLKYLVMTGVLQKYMRHKKFPLKLQKIIMKYYAIKFQSYFFVESRLLETVTGQLREDIIMHTTSHAVQTNKFISQLPRSLQMQLALKFKAEKFTAGDIIFKANSIGHCIYFIDRGTATVYTASGQEFLHLEDGDYFGERCILMKNNVRFATVVAVTDCEMFRLDRDDFYSSVACYPDVFEKMKRESLWRYERLCVLDEYGRELAEKNN